jgi:ADP-heptose:LPS heptosyltransferase
MLVGGPADNEQLAEVEGFCSGGPPVFQDLDLLSLGGLLAQADLFIGHDSGVTHLAAALHVPTIAIFGPTDCNRWAPTGSHVTVLTGAPCPCREQGWPVVQRCRDKPCLQISAERLILACRQRLQRPEDVRYERGRSAALLVTFADVMLHCQIVNFFD